MVPTRWYCYGAYPMGGATETLSHWRLDLILLAARLERELHVRADELGGYLGKCGARRVIERRLND